MRKNYKMKKTLMAVSLVGLTSFGTLSAQWAVTNVNDPIYYPLYFGPTGLFTQSLGRMMSATKDAVDSVREANNIQISQHDANQEDSDKRSRLNQGLSDMYKRDLDAMPTIQQCVQLTNRTANAGATSATFSAGGGSGRGAGGVAKANSKEAREDSITSTATAQASLLMNKSTLGTCGGGMDNAISGCSGMGAYAGGDINSVSLTGNIAGKSGNKDIANFSMSADGYKVAQKYANDATLYEAPKYADPAQVAKNPAYVAMYNSVISKLNAANEAFLSVARWKVANTGLSGPALANWNNTKADYQATLGLTPPPAPSLFEMVNFQALNDYAGPNTKDPVALSDQEVMRDISKKLALSNVLALKQVQATEQNTILLAHILAQQTTPVNIQAVNAEYAKTMNIK